MWNTGTYRGGWYGGWWRARQAPLPHAVTIVTVPPTEEPLTLAEAKLRAGLTWDTGDERDALMTDFVRAARAQVESDTDLALLTQTHEISFDIITGSVIVMPPGSMPLQQVVALETCDRDTGLWTPMDPSTYVVDYASGRIGLATGARWPTNLRSFQPWLLTVICGWPTAADLALEAPTLRQAVGLLTAHYATLGRDLASTQAATEIPNGYCELVAPFVAVTVA